MHTDNALPPEERLSELRNAMDANVTEKLAVALTWFERHIFFARGIDILINHRHPSEVILAMAVGLYRPHTIEKRDARAGLVVISINQLTICPLSSKELFVVPSDRIEAIGWDDEIGAVRIVTRKDGKSGGLLIDPDVRDVRTGAMRQLQLETLALLGDTLCREDCWGDLPKLLASVQR